MRAPWLAGLALLCGLAHAQDDLNGCSEDIEAALRAVTPKTGIPGEVAARHCKPWPPSNGRQTAAVMAFEVPGRGEYDRQWVVVLALIDDRTQRILHSHKTTLDGDATTLVLPDSFTLDTARYQLKPGLRALGLRFSSAAPASGAANASSGTLLHLFAPEGRGLREVLALPMSTQELTEGQCLGCPDSSWTNSSLSIAVGPAGPSGWADLIVTEAREAASYGKPDRRLPSLKRRYRYDGRGYSKTPD